MIIQLSFTTLKNIRVGRWLLYQTLNDEVIKVTCGVEQTGTGPANHIYVLTPPVSISVFKQKYPESIEVISMADLDSSSSSVVTEPTPNATTFTAQVTNIPTAGTPVNLPSIVVPDGRALVVASDLNNDVKKLVYVADSALNAADPTKRITLAPGNSTKLFVTNANSVWVDTNLSGQKVIAIVEQ